MNEKVSTQSYRGARDFYPQDMRIRNYIFNTWKKVCKSYAFEEYDFPIVEPFEVFAAKSGEEVVNEQMFNFEDKGGRKLALRPELTPGTVRMLAQNYYELTKPVKWFMIGNNWRFEKPQRGRGREFYQLEVNIFGIPGPEADFEIIQIITEIMSTFGATNEMYEILLSDRRLIAMLLKDLLQLSEDPAANTRRLMDKYKKMDRYEFIEELQTYGLTNKQALTIEQFLNSDLEELKRIFPQQMLEQNEGYRSLIKLFEMLKNNNLDKYCKFDPSIIRGFDYSDGVVYEVFDKDPKNKRSMFGGERFDKLIQIFGDFELEATGFAMGDVTLKDFLEAWNLMPELKEEKYLVTLWPTQNTEEDQKFRLASNNVARSLRNQGKQVETWLESDVNLGNQLKYANKKEFSFAVMIGPDELGQKQYTVKDLITGGQKTNSLEDL